MDTFLRRGLAHVFDLEAPAAADDDVVADWRSVASRLDSASRGSAAHLANRAHALEAAATAARGAAAAEKQPAKRADCNGHGTLDPGTGEVRAGGSPRRLAAGN